MVGSGDFRGIYPKDMESKLHRILKRIKSNLISDPVIKGKIMNTTGEDGQDFAVIPEAVLI